MFARLIRSARLVRLADSVKSKLDAKNNVD